MIQQAADDASDKQHIEQTRLVSWYRYLFLGLWYPHANAYAFLFLKPFVFVYKLAG
jgi:hypothetical protein